MTRFAVLEAEAHGAVFAPGEIQRGFAMEEKALESWEETGTMDDGALAARKRWKAVVKKREPGAWTRGQAYVRLWKEGVRPNYSPLLEESVSAESEVEDKAIAWQVFP